MPSPETTQQQKGKTLNAREVNDAILGLLQRSRRVRITGLEGQNGLAVGLSGDIEVNATGNVGKYLGAFNNGAVIVIRGNAGDLAGDSMTGGGIIIEGDTGRDCGLKMSGGVLVIKGCSGPSPGRGMTGGTVIIGGDVRGDVCRNMSGGLVIVAGNIKGNTGPLIKEGVLLLAGTSDPAMNDCMEVPLSGTDITLLERYLKHYSIDASPRTFRKFVTKQNFVDAENSRSISLDRVKSIENVFMGRNFLDELGILTSDLEAPEVDVNTREGLKIGRPPSTPLVIFDEPFFVDLNNYDGILEEMVLGISTACTIKGLPISLKGKIGPEMRDLFTSQRTRTIYRLDNRRENNDLLMLKGSTILDLSIMGSDGERLPELKKGNDLIDLLAMLRELRVGPLMITLRTNTIQRDLEPILLAGPDCIMLTSQGPGCKWNDIGMVSVEPGFVNGITEANRHFSTMGARKSDVKLVVSTGVRGPLDVIKLLCLGADAVCIQNLIMKDLVRTNDDLEYWRGKDWSEIGEIAIETIEGFRKEFKYLIKDLNLTDHSMMTPKRLVALTYDAASVTGLPLAGYGSVLPMWMQ